MQPFFFPSTDGQRFCIYHPASCEVARGAVVYVHPFAEEMNKSRRMVAMQARLLSSAGFAVLQIDLLGCGDSSGDFGDARWAQWTQDVALACGWLREKTSAGLILWGLRAGCLVLAEAAAGLPEAPDFVFWQPVVSGKQHWQQFMRLKAASEMASGHGKLILDKLRQQLGVGQCVEIAGYSVSPELAAGLEKAELRPATGKGGRVAWFELASRGDASLSPVVQKSIEQWRAGGYEVDAEVIQGPSFWQTTEIEDAPELLRATLKAVESWQ